MKIYVKYKKTPIRYDVYYNDKRIKDGAEIDFSDNEKLLLVERNIFLSKLWPLLAIFNLICGFFGSFDDYEYIRRVQTKILLSYGKIVSDSLTLIISGTSADIQIQGVDNYSLLSREETEPPIIKKRIKIAKNLLIFVPVTILAVIAVALVITYLMK